MLEDGPGYATAVRCQKGVLLSGEQWYIIPESHFIKHKNGTKFKTY
jgi:hypothetical protein